MRWLIARLLFLPTLVWNLSLGRFLRVRDWWNQVEDGVWIGALPLARDATQLHALGVRGVVNTCEEYPGPEAVYRELGMTQLRVPTIDFTAPNLQDVERAVDFINDYRSRGEGVYIHCKAGRGRSATVVLCWLVQARKLSPEAAQQRLLEVRPHVVPNVYRRPVVQQFWKLQPAADQTPESSR